METKKKSITALLAGTVTGGIALTVLLNRRNRQPGKPTVTENVKQFERKLYEDGKVRALLLEKIKQDAEVAVAVDANKKGSDIQ